MKNKPYSPNDAGWLTMIEAAALFPGNLKPFAVWRMTKKGIKRPDGVVVKLRCIRLARTNFTSPEWIKEFLGQLEPVAV